MAARIPLPVAIPFAEVDRPDPLIRQNLPAPLMEAIEGTVRSGKAVKVDGTQWDEATANVLHRRVLELNRSADYRYQIHARREGGLLFFWASTRTKRRKVSRRARA